MTDRPQRMISMRRRADILARERAAESPDLGALSQNEVSQLIHDLRVHQIELEMQNDELHRVETRLQASRARYLDLYDLAPVGYCTLNGKGLILEANLTLALMLGLARGDMMGRPFSEFVQTEARDGEYLFRRRLTVSREPGSDEFRMVKEDGTTFWARVEGAAATNDDGVVTLRLALSDITDLKLGEAAMRSHDARYRALFDSTLDAIVLSTPDGRITAANAACCRLLGRTEEEIKRGGRDGIFDPEDPRVTSAIEERDRTGSFRGELTLLRAGGSKFEGDVSSSVSTDESGTARASVIIRDVTEQRAAEEALLSSLRDKRALLHEIHHRVKNNLQVITSLLRMEARRQAETSTTAVLKTMQNRIQALALLHETLYRSGTFAFVDLDVYLAQVANHSFRAAMDESQRISLELNLAPARTSMDRAIPCGLFVNELISNCGKHGFPDGRTGTIRVELQPIEGGPTHRLSVSDTGVGLPADFESRRGKSLGLQLAGDLAGQIGGKLEIGPGPAFSVVFSSGIPSGDPPEAEGPRG